MIRGSWIPRAWGLGHRAALRRAGAAALEPLAALRRGKALPSPLGCCFGDLDYGTLIQTPDIFLMSVHIYIYIYTCMYMCHAYDTLLLAVCTAIPEADKIGGK